MFSTFLQFLLVSLVFLGSSIVPMKASAGDEDLRQSFFLGREELYVEKMHFSKTFKELRNIDIDAKRKKRVSLELTGNFPVLQNVFYEGTFGVLNGALTGAFSDLEHVVIQCTSCKISLDCRGSWGRDCRILIRNHTEPVCLYLPKDIGVVVYTRTSLGGKVSTGGQLVQVKKGFRDKIFKNHLAGNAPVTLTVEIETANKGSITLL